MAFYGFSALFLGTAFALGRYFLKAARLDFADPILEIAAYFPVGFLFLSFLILIEAIILPFRAAIIAGMIIAAMLAAILWRRSDKFKNGGQRYENPLTKTEYIFLAVFLIFYLSLLLPALDQTGQGLFRTLTEAGYLDVPYHLSQITHMASSRYLDFQEPNFSGEPLHYPFLINLLSAALYAFGPNHLVFSFQLISIILGASGMLLGYEFLRRYLKNAWQTIAAYMIFLFGAGFGFVRIIQDTAIKHFSFPQLVFYIFHLPYALTLRDGAVWPDQNISFGPPLAGFLVFQRSFLFGFPLFIIALLLLLKALKTEDPWKFRVAGFFAGLLPLAHMHSFIAILLVALGFFVAEFKKTRPRTDPTSGGYGAQEKLFAIQKVLAFLAPALLIGLPQILFLLFGSHEPSFPAIQFRLGWMNGTSPVGGVITPNGPGTGFIPWLIYMLMNFGFILPLLIAAFFIFRKEKTRAAEFTLPLAFLWIAPNVLQLQPWDFDTNKFFVFGIFLAAPAIVLAIERIKKRTAVFGKTLFTILFIALIISGALTVIPRSIFLSPPRETMLTSQNLNLINWIKQKAAPESIFLTSVQPINIVSSFAGRRIVYASELFLYTHGIDFRDRDAQIKKFLKDPAANQEVVKVLNINYILVDDQLRKDYPGVETKLHKIFGTPAYDQNRYAIYSIKI